MIPAEDLHKIHQYIRNLQKQLDEEYKSLEECEQYDEMMYDDGYYNALGHMYNVLVNELYNKEGE